MAFQMFPTSDDFFTDRVCRRYGVILFIAVALGFSIVTRQGDQLQCWTPSQFTNSHNLYTQAICQTSGTFFIPTPILSAQRDFDTRTHSGLPKLNYLYIILVLQILVFLFPRTIWKFLTNFVGFSTNSFVKTVNDVMINKNDNWSSPANRLLALLKSPCPWLQGFFKFGGGFILIPCYMLAKFGYLLCCILQFIILNKFLRFNFFSYRFYSLPWEPFEYTEPYGNGSRTITVQPFPRVVLCDFEIRHQARVHSYVTQCDVTISQTIECCLFIIWLFLWAALILTILSALCWLVKIALYLMASKFYREARMKALMPQLFSNKNGKSESTKAQFIHLMTKPDGLFIMEMLDDNISLYAMSRVCEAAWHLYKDEREVEEVQHTAPATGRKLCTAETVPLCEQKL